MILELTCTTQTLLSEIASPRFKQKNIAQTYHLALKSSEETDWKKVNDAIIERWSIAGLERIKALAWSGKCFNDEVTK